jgi:S1-C subfamily serine protease
MQFKEFTKNLFFWTALVIGISYVHTNWDAIKMQVVGPPTYADLEFTQASNVNTPVIMSSDEQITTKVFEDSHRAVVNIAATTLTRNYWNQITPQEGQGSGFIIDDEGYILTNNHVVEKADKLSVTLKNDTKVEAKLIGRDPSTDLAVIKIPKKYVIDIAPLGNSDKIRVGQKAIAIGNPFGLSHTLTTGIISALDRKIRGMNEHATMYDLIQTDAAINPGNSGGPLLNSSGEVVGINTAIFSRSGGNQGIGFAIPINRAKQVAAQLITKGKYAHPWLGLSGIDLNAELANELNLKIEKGVMTVSIVQDGPAFKAGLRGGDKDQMYHNIRVSVGGDIITEVNGKAIENMAELIEVINHREVGDSLNFKVWRDDAYVNIETVLEEKPSWA